MQRRRFIACGCAHGAAWGLGLAMAPAAWSQSAAAADWTMPERFTRPDLASEEGGLWAIMDREESRLRRSPFKLRDTSLQAYLERIVARLAGPHVPDVRIHVVRVPMFNASMAPNGMMQVWTGLLLRVENEAQLAAVLAHEIAHFLQRHTLHNLRDLKDRAAFGNFLALFGLVGMVAQVGMIAGAYGFSRDQEREADRIGQRLMRQAGYHPREAATIWRNLVAESLAGGAEAQQGALFATHPGSDERAATLAELAGDQAGEIAAEAYRERLAPWRLELLRDELRRDRPAETLALLDRLMAVEPKSAELRYVRGLALKQRAAVDDTGAALAEFEAAVALGDEPPQTHRDMGYVLQKLDRAADARAAFERYLQLAPTAADAPLIKSLTETPS